MKMLYLNYHHPVEFISGQDKDDVKFGPPDKFDFEGRSIELNLQTQIALAIDVARTIGCDKIVFPFKADSDIRVAKNVMKNYRDQGWFMDYQFPLVGR